LKPRAGRVKILGDDLARLGRKAISRRIASVGQEGSAAFPFTVLEAVLMGRAPHLAPLRFESNLDVAIALDSMRRFGIEDLAQRFIQELSGGERKRVFLARALSQQPALMLLDEPTAFLDLKHVAGIFEVFREIRAERGVAIVATLHDLNAAAEYADRVMLIKDGASVGSGSPSEILTEQTLRSVYETDLSIGKNPATGSIAIFPSAVHPVA
ncbi:MAG TPA: ABC transporter ATP-binding protein, partial [Candidatus Binataceae bacterium]